MYARGAILGLTRGSTKAHLARAALEGIAFQVRDLHDCMETDSGSRLSVLRVDGGASVSTFMMQFQADMLKRPIDRPRMVETTAFGAAFLAGLASGVWSDISEITKLRVSERIFEPRMPDEAREELLAGWRKAVSRAQKWAD